MNAFFNLSEMDFLGKEEVWFDLPQEPEFIFDKDIPSHHEIHMDYQNPIEKCHLEGSFQQSFAYEDACDLEFSKPEIPLFEPKKSFPWNPAEIGQTPVPMCKAKAKKPSDYKNFARNMVNIIISNLRTFKSQLSRFASAEELELNDILNYTDSCKDSFTSVKSIQDSWNTPQEDSSDEAKCKRVFHRFCAWFLRKKMPRYIIKEGKMRDRVEYLKYKNRVMRKGVKRPEAYTSNFFELLND